MSGLWPREHGAYAQLGFPLLTGLIYADGHGGAVGFAVAALALFFAHEPLAVRAGVRGTRLARRLAGPARQRLLVLGGVAAAGAAVAVGLAPARAWWATLVPAVPALALLPRLATRELKSLPGEILAAGAFSTSLLPLALCGETTWRTAGVAAAVWFAAMVPAILSVHAIKVAFRGKEEGRWTVTVAPVSAALVATAATVAALLLPGWARDLLAVTPPAAAVVALGVIRPHPRHLKRVGWTMVAANTAALALLLLL